MDKKVAINNEQKEEIDHLLTQINTKYFEISSVMFFPMDKFFENLIFYNFSNLPILSSEESKKYFHEILTQKKVLLKQKGKLLKLIMYLVLINILFFNIIYNI